MNIIKKIDSTKITLKGFFEENKIVEKNLLTKKFSITEYLEKNVAYMFLGKKDDFSLSDLKIAIEKIVKLNTREFQINPKDFLAKSIDEKTIITKFIEIDEFFNGKGLYSAKTNKESKKIELSIIIDQEYEDLANRTLQISSLVNNARRLQATPPNICNSEWLANDIEQMFKGIKNTKIKVLNKKEIEKEKMGLFLSVNKGSAFEPRLVVIEYLGNPSSSEKVAFIGKGITFDSGGYNLKPSQHIQGMKYDMSGAAICASAIKGVVDFAPKTNVVAILPLTDNKISSNAQTPDSIWESMSGKTVEVNNTDAEGRLILADAITYAIKHHNVSQIIDVATLTGAIIVSLGTTFTGAWATSEQSWQEIKRAADIQDELIWRLPFHEDFLKNIKNSNFADYKNTDLSGKGGSISAAMFLKEFTEDREYIHLDIAGTGGTGENPTGVMVKTLIQFALNKDK